MLALLRIKNLALVEELEWSPAAGFVAITGETGAGKSIILGALKLLLGDRADKSLIRAGTEACTVEAEFHIPRDLQLNPQLLDQGVEPCIDGTLILKRSFGINTGSRQFINGSTTTLNVLKWVGDALVDLHGPHDHQSLFSIDTQLELLDAYAKAIDLRRQHEDLYQQFVELNKELVELGGTGGDVERELDLLKHQIDEIEELNLKPTEETELLATYQRAANGRRLVELATSVVNILEEGDEALRLRLAESQKLLQDLAKLDPQMEPRSEEHRSAVVILEELTGALRDYAEGLDLDAASLDALEQRVNALESVKRKYGGTLEAAHDFAQICREKLQRLEGRGERLEILHGEIDKVEQQRKAVAQQLHALRNQAAPQLAQEVSAHLADLGFKQAHFAVDLHAAEKAKATGEDSVEFLFAPNPGEPVNALRDIASSGEISRVMLALKTALAREDNVALMVFDEIDANVGGEIAHAVAQKMKQIGERRQVLVITHLPQVASKAAHHFLVLKEVIDGRTHSRLRPVEGPDRVKEIARMLGGQSDSAVAHAEALLQTG